METEINELFDWIKDHAFFRRETQALAMNRKTFGILNDHIRETYKFLKSGDDVKYNSAFGIRIVLDNGMQDGELEIGDYCTIVNRAKLSRDTEEQDGH